MVSKSEKNAIAEHLSIDEGVPVGEVLTSGDTRVSAFRHLEQARAEQIFEMIEKGFADHNSHSLLKQDMTRDELLAEAGDLSVINYIAESIETGELQGYLSVHSNLDDITWADRDLLKAQQAAVGPGEVGFYVGTFVVPKELRGLKVSGLLLEASLTQLVNFNRLNGHKSLCFFDRSDAGSSAMKELIDRKLKKIAGEEEPFEIQEVDRIYYETVQLPDYPGYNASEGPSDTVQMTSISGENNDYLLVENADFDSGGNLTPASTAVIRERLNALPDGSQRLVVAGVRELPSSPQANVLDVQHFYAIVPSHQSLTQPLE